MLCRNLIGRKSIRKAKEMANSNKDIERRKKLYGCDGICYSRTSICPNVDHCPETREKEFLATVVAALIPIAGIGTIILIAWSLLS